MHGDPEQLKNFMRMEKWIFDSPDQPARAFREFIQWFYHENRLIRGELTLDGTQVLLKNIKCPVLNINTQRTIIWFPAQRRSIPLGAHVGCEDYERFRSMSATSACMVSGKARKVVPAAITRWLLKRNLA